MAVYDKLQQVQASLNVPKGQYNDFGKFSYRSCEDIMEAVKPILAKVGAALIVGDELVQFGDRYYIKATARFIDIQDGSELTNTAWAREPEEKKGMDSSQITGATSSYARKYSLNGLFCLDDVKDADTMDNTDSKGKAAPRQTAKSGPTGNTPIGQMDSKYLNSLKDEMNRKFVSEDKILDRYKVKAIEELTFQQYQSCMKSLEKTKAPINPPEILDNPDDPELPWNQAAPKQAQEKPKKKTKREQATELYDELLESEKFT